MDSKSVLMIHQIDDSLFNKDLENYVLTFDDGTVDHYDYFHQFDRFNTVRIYFIIPTKIGTDGYLTLEQVRYLMLQPNTYIGGHSYYHRKFDNEGLLRKTHHIHTDTQMMIDWFEKNLGFKPTKFCFPYNDDVNGVYAAMMKNFGIRELYGKERIDASTLS
jgi:Polysaccharide deacetylase